MTTHSRISGFGFSLPERELGNEELTASSNITDEWILTRTGIQTRRILAPGQNGSDLALAATLSALKASGKTSTDISHILYATCTPDAACPSAACTLANKLELNGCMAVDLNAACTGFVYGLELADALLSRTPQACVLLVAAEALSHRCNMEDPGTAVLFGDGAGAVICTAYEGANADSSALFGGGIIDVSLGSDASKADLLHISGGYSASPYKLGDTVGPDYFIRMQGGAVFKQAVRNMTNQCNLLLERNGLLPEDIDVFIPHQANLRIIEAVGSRLGIEPDRVFLNVQKYGNTSAASIPIALGEAVQSGFIQKGHRVLVTSFGGGLTYGAALLQF